MTMKSLIAPLLVATALAALPVAASAKSPVFGDAKHVSLSSNEMSKVVGKTSTASYYGYYGLYYSYYASLYGFYGYAYSYYYYYYLAYQYSSAAASNFYNAYYYQYYGY